MRLRPSVLVFLLTAVVVFAAGCTTIVTGYIVYIDNDICQARSWDGDTIEDLWVLPGDKVVWVNTSEKELTLKFESDAIFGAKEVVVAAGKRATTNVVDGASGSVEYMVVPCDGGVGTPRVRVGAPP
jgi:hypothetical protein